MSEGAIFQQEEQGMMVYPGASRWRRFLFRLPILAWRLGMGSFVQSTFIILTTIGRKSGQPRRTALEFTFQNGSFYLASGWGKRANWYQNAIAHPYVTLQHNKMGVFHGHVVEIDDEDEIRMMYGYLENSPMWKSYMKSWGIAPNLDDFLAKKERLALLRIDPTSEATPPPQKADLAWVWLPFALILLFINPMTRRIDENSE